MFLKLRVFMDVIDLGAIGGLAGQLSVGIFGALLGSWAAARRYRSEALWQAKYDMYRDLIDALEEVSLWASETHADRLCLVGSPLLNGQSAIRLDPVGKRRVISKISRIGNLLMPDELIELLVKLESDLKGEDFRAEDEREVEQGDHNAADFHMAEHAQKIGVILNGKIDQIVGLAKAEMKKV